jgi:hypothetical protein
MVKAEPLLRVVDDGTGLGAEVEATMTDTLAVQGLFDRKDEALDGVRVSLPQLPDLVPSLRLEKRRRSLELRRASILGHLTIVIMVGLPPLKIT